MTAIRAGLGTRMVLEKHPEPIPILYVDDDQADADALEASLTPSVVNPIISFNKAQDLYDYLDMNEGPFIILVDLVLFGDARAMSGEPAREGDTESFGGGYEILERLRRRPDVNDTRSPILAVTATLPDPALIERVKATGADAFIHKPVRSDDLVTAIGRPGWFRVELSR